MAGSFKPRLFAALALALALGAMAWAWGKTPWKRGQTEAPSAAHSRPKPPRGPDSCFTDRFSGQNPRWNWNETEGSGYHRLAYAEGATAVEIGIGPGGGPDESDSSFEERSLSRKNGRCFFDIRCEEPNTDSGAGTMGWGLWRPGGADELDAVWFLSCSAASDERYRGFFAMVIRRGKIVFGKKLGADLTARHAYAIEIRPEKTVFIIDGNSVAESGPLPPGMPCMKMVCWIDNKVLSHTDGKTLVTHGRAALAKRLFLFEAGFKPLAG